MVPTGTSEVVIRHTARIRGDSVKERQIVRNLLGVVCLALLGMLMFYAKLQKPEETKWTEEKSAGVEIQWETDTIFYDGSRELDLMEGVQVVDTQGVDRTADTKAVLQSTERIDQKNIYYTVEGETLKTDGACRTLVLKGYEGPVLDVASEVRVDASQLNNLVSELVLRGWLRAENGYQVDASSQVRWYRAKLKDGVYELTFTLVNEFGDQISARCTAYISGVTDDLILELTNYDESILVGTPFDPMQLVLQASQADGTNMSKQVTVRGEVDNNRPGTYILTYTLISADGTQQVTKQASVEVREKGE